MIKILDKKQLARKEAIAKQLGPMYFICRKKVISTDKLLHKLFITKEATYNEAGEVTCTRGRQRSIFAAYQILNTYGKKISYTEIYDYLIKKNVAQYFHYCSTVKKPVFKTYYRVRSIPSFKRYKR